MIERLREFYEAAEVETEARAAQTSMRELEDKRQLFAQVQGTFSKQLWAENDVSMIAEFKQSSPSKGEINAERNVMDVALAYKLGGAAAMSVLTLGHKFSGSLDYVSQAQVASGLPILRKDFIDDEYQILEAAGYGAAAVLLIVGGIEDDGELKHLYDYASELGLDSLVEVHTEDEVQRAKNVGAKIIGVNNRDLRDKDMKEDLGTFRKIAPLFGDTPLVVAESGYRADNPSHKEELRAYGSDAVLMGTDLMKSPDPEQAVRTWVDN